MFLLLLAQATATPPDLQLDLRATAREVRIERRGDVSLELRADPDGGTDIRVEKPETQGRRRLRNVGVRVQAEARIADPQATRTEAETGSPQGR